MEALQCSYHTGGACITHAFEESEPDLNLFDHDQYLSALVALVQLNVHFQSSLLLFLLVRRSWVTL